MFVHYKKKLDKKNRVSEKSRYKRRIDELRVEFGVKDNFKKKLVRSSLIWASLKKRIGDEKLPDQKVEGKRR